MQEWPFHLLHSDLRSEYTDNCKKIKISYDNNFSPWLHFKTALSQCPTLTFIVETVDPVDTSTLVISSQ